MADSDGKKGDFNADPSDIDKLLGAGKLEEISSSLKSTSEALGERQRQGALYERHLTEAINFRNQELWSELRVAAAKRLAIAFAFVVAWKLLTRWRR